MSVGLSEYITNTLFLLNKSVPTDFRQYSDNPTIEKEVHGMGVYKIENSELVRVAETIEELVRPDWADWDEHDEFMHYLGFVTHDEVVGVYKLMRRENLNRPDGELPGVRWLFDLDVDGSSIDYIMVGDDLPGFLRTLELVEPLVRRADRHGAEVLTALRR